MDLSPLTISLKTSIAATALAIFFGILAARFVFGIRGRARIVLETLFSLPLVLPPTVIGFFLLLAFGRNSIIGTALAYIDIRVVFSPLGNVVAAAVVAFPLIFRTARASFESVDKEILYAARTLGLSEWNIFYRILIPLSWNGLIAGAALGFARALGEFGATLMLAGDIPGKTRNIPTAIYVAANGDGMDAAFAWVITICIISFLLCVVMYHFEKRKAAQ